MNRLEPEQQLQEIEQVLPYESVDARALKLPRQLSSFKHRNYRLFFCGQFISLIGTWLQIISQGWLVFQMTNSALLLGVVGFANSIPILLFSLPAGLIVDRFDKRRILMLTQTGAMVLAFILAALTYWHVVKVYHVIILGFLLGTINALDAPTRQAFVVDMVGKKNLLNAITLNSAMFNGARIIGPAIAGATIAWIGIAGAFFLNGLSFIAVLIGLLFMQLSRKVEHENTFSLQRLKEGILFVHSNPRIKGLLLLIGSTSVFSMSYAVLMPIFARDILHVGVKGFGYLMTSAGIGALLGAVTLSFLGDFKGKRKLLLAGNLVFNFMLILFSLSRVWYISAILLMIAGWGMMVSMALINTLIQTSVPDYLRGRIMSLYTLMFLGMAPFGSLLSGSLAHWITAPVSVRITSFLCAIISVLISPLFLKEQEND